ncbi:MAG: hypothetical protein IPL23_17175 [Saprospiraceae bacterium]|nr:hypothetical protein [Saprospiraceae bacterium]
MDNNGTHSHASDHGNALMSMNQWQMSVFEFIIESDSRGGTTNRDW